jgi:hypothetical protein
MLHDCSRCIRSILFVVCIIGITGTSMDCIPVCMYGSCDYVIMHVPRPHLLLARRDGPDTPTHSTLNSKFHCKLGISNNYFTETSFIILYRSSACKNTIEHRQLTCFRRPPLLALSRRPKHQSSRRLLHHHHHHHPDAPYHYRQQSPPAIILHCNFRAKAPPARWRTRTSSTSIARRSSRYACNLSSSHFICCFVSRAW